VGIVIIVIATLSIAMSSTCGGQQWSQTISDATITIAIRLPIFAGYTSSNQS